MAVYKGELFSCSLVLLDTVSTVIYKTIAKKEKTPAQAAELIRTLTLKRVSFLDISSSGGLLEGSPYG
jgi:hypothetical protein